MIGDSFPRVDFNQVEGEHHASADVHFKPEDEVDWVAADRGDLHEEDAGACEQDEEDGVEETDRVVDDQFVDNGWDDEGDQLDDDSVLAEGDEETVEVDVHVVVEPVVHHDVPAAVVGPELDRVPPVWVECSVRETSQFRPEIEPTMKKTEKIIWR